MNPLATRVLKSLLPALRFGRNVALYRVLRDPSIRSDRFGRELMADLAVRFVKANEIRGSYLEFGVFRGSMFAQFYHLFRRHRLEVPMYAFDSFQGLPKPKGLDATPGFDQFPAGMFTCSEEQFVESLDRRWVPRSAYTIVPGFYRESLTADARSALRIPPAAMIWIDSVLYESVQDVLRFIEPLLQDGTVLMFNDYYRFKGHPGFGERRAFTEFIAAHPEIHATDYGQFCATGQSFLVHLLV
jgi:O-methyltransferase